MGGPQHAISLYGFRTGPAGGGRPPEGLFGTWASSAVRGAPTPLPILTPEEPTMTIPRRRPSRRGRRALRNGECESGLGRDRPGRDNHAGRGPGPENRTSPGRALRQDCPETSLLEDRAHPGYAHRRQEPKRLGGIPLTPVWSANPVTDAGHLRQTTEPDRAQEYPIGGAHDGERRGPRCGSNARSTLGPPRPCMGRACATSAGRRRGRRGAARRFAPRPPIGAPGGSIGATATRSPCAESPTPIGR